MSRLWKTLFFISKTCSLQVISEIAKMSSHDLYKGKLQSFFLPYTKENGQLPLWFPPHPERRRRRHLWKHFSFRPFLWSIKCGLCLVLVKSAQDFAAKLKLGGQLKPLIYLFGRHRDGTNQPTWSATFFGGGRLHCIVFHLGFHSVATVVALLVLLLVAVVVSAHLDRGLMIIIEKMQPTSW